LGTADGVKMLTKRRAQSIRIIGDERSLPIASKKSISLHQ
jgi:hypothetical protein